MRPTFKRGTSTSVLTYTNTKVNKLNEGAPFAKEPLLPTDFWEFLDTWGGKWMWESIDDSQQSKHNLSWLVEGMKLNTLTWVTDGSYDRKRAADLCGVGWVIFCSKTGLRLTGTFWKRSPSASSYRAEMLGLCCLHLLARGISEFYQIQEWEATLSCDNFQAIRIHPSEDTAQCKVRRYTKKSQSNEAHFSG
jgi:hypothetical protein